MLVSQGDRLVDADVGPDRFDADPLEPPALRRGVGAVLRPPERFALLNGGGHLIGKDDAMTGESVLQGVPRDPGLPLSGFRSGGALRIALVGFNLAECGHREFPEGAIASLAWLGFDRGPKIGLAIGDTHKIGTFRGFGHTKSHRRADINTSTGEVELRNRSGTAQN